MEERRVDVTDGRRGGRKKREKTKAELEVDRGTLALNGGKGGKGRKGLEHEEAESKQEKAEKEIKGTRKENIYDTETPTNTQVRGGEERKRRRGKGRETGEAQKR